MLIRVRTLCTLAALTLAPQAHAQSIARDSLYDFADHYWRGRLTVSAPSGDSLGITCSGTVDNVWTADVRFFGAQPWSPDALTTTNSYFFGFSASSTSSRMTVMWPDDDRDRWQITFFTGRGFGGTVAEAQAGRNAATGARSGWLTNGDGFLTRLVKHGRVSITYPVADWVRSFEMVFSEAQMVELKAMRARCWTKYEGTRQSKAGS